MMTEAVFETTNVGEANLLACVPHLRAFALEFGDFRRAFWQLGDDRREALILIGANGLSYSEAVKICDCPRGTIKSRVSRARRELPRILEDGLLADKRRDTPPISSHIGDLFRGRRATSSLAAA